jgi:hypothetical protein
LKRNYLNYLLEQGRGNVIIDEAYSLGYSLAMIVCLVVISQLQSFIDSGAGTRGDSSSK